MSWFKPTSRNDASIAVLLGDTPGKNEKVDRPAAAADSADAPAATAPPPSPAVPSPVVATPRPVVESQRLTPLRAAPEHTPPVSILGRTLRFRGELHADEDFVLQGSIEGSIHHTQHLVIGADGVVKGDSRARTLVVEGTVHGDLYAIESIMLAATATVNGNLYGPRISIAEGAVFNGRVDMSSAAKAARSVLERQDLLAAPEHESIDEDDEDDALSASA